jgi:tRNA(His) guanylyltransferase
MPTLSDRQQKYIETFDYTILPRLPIIARAEIRNFPRLKKNLEKPFAPELWRILRETMYSTVMELEGAVFSFHHNAEINFILGSSQESYSNKIQKICSIVSGLCGINFLKHSLASDDPPDLVGECLFETHVFGVPSLSETVNYLFWRQQAAINHSVFDVIEAKNKNLISSLGRKSLSEKKDLLLTECGINYEDYPSYFKQGSACYKVPKLYGESIKKKWHLDTELPELVDNKDFILNILHTGQDCMRPDRDIVK